MKLVIQNDVDSPSTKNDIANMPIPNTNIFFGFTFEAKIAATIPPINIPIPSAAAKY
ncbi:Uncharacterised protein [Streptococcus pneumoniae]|nr:Uncharacterised protein [Streptococcus pneumoniae]